MSFHLKFRFVLAMLMGLSFVLLSPWISHRPIARHAQAQAMQVANFAMRDTQLFDDAALRTTLAANAVADTSR